MAGVMQGLILLLIIMSLDDAAIGEDEMKGRGSDLAGDASLMANMLSESPGADMFNPCPNHMTGFAGEIFTDFLATMLISECLLGAPCTYPVDVGSYCRPDNVFDFIIIGAGTAGCVVASRLSEVCHWDVLVLEAGGDPPMSSDIPFYFSDLQKIDTDWGYVTEKDKGMYNGFMSNVNRWPRGKALGGTSSINMMMYVRGNSRDYDNWAADGSLGWSYEDILPLFKKSEDMRDMGILSLPTFNRYHGNAGPMVVSRFGSELEIIPLILNASMELGISSNLDTSVTQNGVASPNQGMIRIGERLNTAKAFLNPVKKRKNLFVVKHALVTKIHICPTTRRAYAVSYYYKNEKIMRVVKASREIILCAGAIESPHLLLLSGVGPRKQLESFGIPIIQEAWVGINLQDHVCFLGAPIALQGLSSDDNPLADIDEMYEYLSRRSGPLATIGSLEVVTYLNDEDDDLPDAQIFFLFAEKNDKYLLPKFLKNAGIKEEYLSQFNEMNKDNDLLLPIPVILHPKSRGKISLKSCDPRDYPIISPNYLTEPEDLKAMLKAIRVIERYAETDAFGEHCAELRPIEYDGCCGLEPLSDQFWACALSHLASTFWDPVGTVKMGPLCEPDTVVDPLLRVRGVKALRVADTSIIPNIITGNTAATAMMIGEKVSDMIKQTWLNCTGACCTANCPCKKKP